MTVESNIAQSAIDFHGLNQLRQQANSGQNEQATLKQVAGQFESLFVMMMLKSMRQASLAEGVFDSKQTKMYQDMFDQQLASNLGNRGGLGLRDVIYRQLGGEDLAQQNVFTPNQAYSADTITVRPELGVRVNRQVIDTIKSISPTIDKQHIESSQQAAPADFETPQDFVNTFWPMAEKAAKKIGVAPELILSQAALETGWGKYIIDDVNGDSSFNLFNIKANQSWSGSAATHRTLEYIDGKPVTQLAQFRQYNSYQDSFDDYVAFLQTQPRYQAALEQSHDAEAFIEAIHQAGYATDPQYADKVKRIMRSDMLARISLETP